MNFTKKTLENLYKDFEKLEKNLQDLPACPFSPPFDWRLMTTKERAKVIRKFNTKTKKEYDLVFGLNPIQDVMILMFKMSKKFIEKLRKDYYKTTYHEDAPFYDPRIKMCIRRERYLQHWLFGTCKINWGEFLLINEVNATTESSIVLAKNGFILQARAILRQAVEMSCALLFFRYNTNLYQDFLMDNKMKFPSALRECVPYLRRCGIMERDFARAINTFIEKQHKLVHPVFKEVRLGQAGNDFSIQYPHSFIEWAKELKKTYEILKQVFLKLFSNQNE